MKNKFTKKIMFFIIINLILITIIPTISMAFDPIAFNTANKPDMSSGVAEFGGKIIFIIQYVGYSISVLVLLGVGMKYMLSSPSEKADIKSRLMPFAIGAILLFGGVSIVSMAYDILTVTVR